MELSKSQETLSSTRYVTVIQPLIMDFLTLNINCNVSQAEIYAELGEIIAGTKPLPKVPECGKKFIVFKSLGKLKELSCRFTSLLLFPLNTQEWPWKM